MLEWPRTMNAPDVGHANSTSARILSAAASLFRQKGYSATTTRELAAAAGIQKASLYHHFRTKEDLLYEITMGALDRVTAEVSQAMKIGATPSERLQNGMRTHLTTALGDRDIYATMLFDLRALSAERQRSVIRRRRDYESMIEKEILAAQRAGELRTDVDARHLTLALLNLLNWTMFWFNPRGPYSVTQLGEVLVTIFLDGVRLQARPNAPARRRSSQSRSRS